MPEAVPDARRLARSVNRALGDLRRGVAVMLGDAPRVALLPMETATEHTLAEFIAASTGPRFMILASGRALALASEMPPPDADIVTLLCPEELARDIAALRRMADPVSAVSSHGAHLPHLAQASAPGTDVARAAISLAKLARLLPAMLCGEARLGCTADLLSVSIEDTLHYPGAVMAGLTRAAEASVPLADAPSARIVAFRPPDGGIEHLAIVIGAPEGAGRAGVAPLVRIHSECFTGDLLGSLRCDCGPQLHQAIREMEQEGAGIVLYMAQEGRGIGLVNKLRAYRLQDGGLDTIDANQALGFGADERSFGAAAIMLRALEIGRVRLLTNNLDKVAALEAAGIEVTDRVPLAIPGNGVNDFYLDTKARRFGHVLG